MKIVFMGTPDFAVAALEALIEQNHEILAVVTQPDKPRGRSGELQASPVKECALRHGIPVLQPRRIKTPEAVAELKKYPAEVYIVAAFGQILSQEILDIPPFGCLNIHASLLPGYRGASPIQHVILAGEPETGVTIMQMDAGLDTGDMLYKKKIQIDPCDTFETLHDKLAVLGGQAVTEALPLLEEGKLTPEKQRDEDSCYAPLIDKSMGKLDFAKDAIVLERLIRGMNPWPSAYTVYKGKQLKIWRAQARSGREEAYARGAVPGISDGSGGTNPSPAPEPGEILAVEKDALWVAAGSGCLRILELQLEGRKRMAVRDFLLGVKLQPGEVLG